MADQANALLVAIETTRDGLSRSEARVADFILGDPNRAVEMSIATLAAAASVSEPTVARFCKSMGFSGLKDFKLRLARSLGASVRVHQDVSPQDSAASATTKVLDRAARGIAGARDSADHASISRAAEAIATARRVEFYGQGNSGIVALDAQHKFFRLGIATAAYSDPHVHAMSAATLGPRDVVMAISASGRSVDLIRSVEIAKNAGVTVVALTTRGSPLMRLADIAIATDIEEDPDLYAPMVSRLVHLALIDALAVLVALKQGTKAQSTLDRGKRSLRDKHAAF